VKEPPHSLALAWKFEKWGLPYAGGYFEQPLRVMREAEAALAVWQAFSSRAAAARAKKLFEWSEEYPQWAALCAEVEQWRGEADYS